MRTYEEEDGLDRLFRSSPGETIIGSKEAKRSTKTFITSERSAIVLSLIENHARGIVRTLMKLHFLETKRKLSPEEIVDRYSGAKRWVDLHQQLLEHFASTEGFSVQAVVKMEQARLMMQQQRSESSVKVEDGLNG